MKGIPMLFEDVAAQQPFDYEGGGHQREHSKPALLPGYACLPDVGRGKEVIWTRQ